MGAYLSTPATEKKSDDLTKSEKYDCGVSGMQGWRISMEDAFNCDPDMDNDVGFFAVYDGHGGGEVAMYCSHHFKSILKDTDEYKEGKFEDALKTTFMKIDKKLKEPRIVKELKLLSQMEPGDPPITEDDIIKMEEQEEEEKDNAEEETKLLCEEATMNIEDLLAKYGRVVNETKEVMRALKHKDEDVATAEDVKLDADTGSASSKQECKISATSDIETPALEDGTSSDNNIDEGKLPTEQKPSAEQIPQTESKPTPDEGAGVVTSQKLKKTFIKIKSVKSEEESDDDDDYEGFESDEAIEGSSSEDEESSEEEESGEEEPLEIHEETPEEESVRPSGGMEEPGSDSGTTAVVALLHGRTLHVANAGDSRCVLSRKEGVAFDMSDDHKPEDEEELARIKAAGGQVNLQGRVNGGLNLSRAIGDHSYKTNENLPLEDQMISAMPDVRSVALQPGDEFMVVACDGIWNVLSSQEVVDFIRDRLFPHKDLHDNEPAAEPMKISQICEELFDRCLAPDTMGDGTGCDNMTCVIVRFNQDWLKKGVPATEGHSTQEIVSSKTGVAASDEPATDVNDKGDLYDAKRAITDDVIPMKATTKRPLSDTLAVVNGNGVPTKRAKAD